MSAFLESVRTESVVVPDVKAKPAAASGIVMAIPPVSASLLLGTVPITDFVGRMLYAVDLLHVPMTLTAQGDIVREINVRSSLVVTHHLWLNQVYVLRVCVKTLLQI